MKRLVINPKLASAVGFVLLIVVIWLVGPLLGLGGTPERLVATSVVLGLWVTGLLTGRFFARRAGRLVEHLLQRQADDAVLEASADRRAEINTLRQRLLAAIDTLKRSRIGRMHGDAALYELPWYMIIGHPAAGKSSAVMHSGLNFPIGDKHGVQGVGGTRNCDWFFSTEGVLLDTAGRYTTQSEDRAEWIAFLRLLKRHRARAPVNGILIAISLTELADYKSERFTAYVRQIRERIHEIDSTFGLQVPTYLLVTKLDLLAGFSQFFDHLTEEERSRVWGATLTDDQRGAFDLERVVGGHFDALYQGLRQIGEERLAGAQNGPAHPAMFAFPIEFHAMKEALCRFVELLSEDDPYHGRPLLRGFYFTSALQQGVPRLTAAARVSSRFALSRSGFEARQVLASYSYFLRDLFREVLFPDQHLISRQTRPGRGRWRLAGLAGGLTMLALVCGAMTWSFVGNQKMMAAAHADQEQAAALLASDRLRDRLQGLVLLQGRLEQLQHFRESGHPWQVGLGLYQGGKVEGPLRMQYFAGLRSVMLEPVKANLEQTLRTLARAPAAHPVFAPPRRTADAEPRPVTAAALGAARGLPIIPLAGHAALARHVAPPAPARVAVETSIQGTASLESGQGLEHGYNALKTYVMLHEQARMEQAHLGDQVPRYWRPWLEQHRGEHSIEELGVLAERVIAFYLAQLRAPDLPLIANDLQVVEPAREILRNSLQRLSATQRVYNELRARANTRYAPLSVSRILAGKDAAIVAGSAMVPGAYTRDAWDQYVRTAITEASKGEIKSDDWVLALTLSDELGKDSTLDKSRAELVALYREDYRRAWNTFLQGVAVLEQRDLGQTAEALGRMADPQNSPIRLILTRAAHELAWESSSGAHGPGAQGGGPDEGGNGIPPKAVRSVEHSSGVAGLKNIAGVESDNGLMSAYLELLARVQGRLSLAAAHDEPASVARQFMHATLTGSGSELSQALEHVDAVMLADADESSRQILRPILVRPLVLAYAALIPPVERELNHAWQKEVYGQWRQVADKYPFSDTQHEAALGDISRFVRPDGTLTRFVDKHLEGLVLKRGDQIVPRTWGNQGLRFNPTFLSGAGRLIAFGDKLALDGEAARFELQPLPTPGLSEISIEIAGQTLRYRNGPQAWQEFRWPGDQERHGARIQVVDFAGAVSVLSSQPGRMGLVRLLAEAAVRDREAGATELEWKPASGERPVKMNLRTVSGVNPLQIAGIRRLALPERITP